MLSFLEIIAIIVRYLKNNWVQHDKMTCHYIPLINIITYYVTIMTLIAIMAINILLCHIYDYVQKAKSAFSEENKCWNGQHT